MSFLFYADVKKNIVLHPDCVALCPELKLLSSKEILFIILAFDYNSIYRQFPERQRLSKAIFHVWGDNKPNLLDESKREKRLQIGIEAYKSLQYDRNIELKEMYNRKIDSLIARLEDEDSSTTLKNIRESIDGFRKDIRKMDEEIVDKKLFEGELMGNASLSWLEDRQKNVKYYKSSITKRV